MHLPSLWKTCSEDASEVPHTRRNNSRINNQNSLNLIFELLKVGEVIQKFNSCVKVGQPVQQNSLCLVAYYHESSAHHLHYHSKELDIDTRDRQMNNSGQKPNKEIKYSMVNVLHMYRV